MEYLHNTINQFDLINMCKLFYPITVEHTFFQSAYRIFTKINNVLSHETSFNKFQRIDIIQCMFADHI